LRRAGGARRVEDGKKIEDEKVRKDGGQNLKGMISPSEILPAEGIPPGSFHGVKMIAFGKDEWMTEV